jgi:predicted RND superfamily exporter protein
MQAIQQFGLFSVIGVLVIIMLSVVFAPALLVIMGKPKKALAVESSEQGNLIDNFISRVARFDYQYSKPIFLMAFVVFVISLIQIFNIRIGTEYVGNFNQQSDVAISFERVNSELAGANIFSVVLESQNPDAFKQPENLRVAESLQNWLVSQQEIGSAISIVEYLKLVNRSMHGDDPQYYRIPESSQEVSQIVDLGATTDLDSVIDKEYRIARIIVRANVIDSDKLSAVIGRIESHLDNISSDLNAGITGNPVLLNKTISMITKGQALSIGFSLVIVYVILSGLFMSFRIGLIALIPNILPVTIYFGALGLFGVTLNPATSLIGPMILGIAVDDTIHYFAHFNRDAKKMANDKKATISSLRAVGRPITYTTIGLCLGFLMFLFSDLKMQHQVGLMAAFTLAFAWLSDFILTPALCAKVRLATLWDALSLDLGADPHKSIPLLAGLRATQARIVALMSSVVEQPSGTRLIQTGDTGKELYVVISGKLESSYDGQDGPVLLNQHSRGDVVGEIGLFNATRSANVDVVEDVRLLRITPNSIERLKTRYPRVAAQVLNNLSQVLAQRLIKATARIK